MWELIKEWSGIIWEWVAVILFGLLALLYFIHFLVDLNRWVERENHEPTNEGVKFLKWLNDLWNSIIAKIAWLGKSEGDLINNIAKALLLGILSGWLIGYFENVWTFILSFFLSNYRIYEYKTNQAIFGGVLVTLSLFLVYNKKK